MGSLRVEEIKEEAKQELPGGENENPKQIENEQDEPNNYEREDAYADNNLALQEDWHDAEEPAELYVAQLPDRPALQVIEECSIESSVESVRLLD
mmetsp:Transcript_825/g.1116  ORF Transcript_825/g.1116 Transcript_825/m.1116 type:complete len:95 (-) Transcript_825:321-605(-)|eukprot:CAMPEP_0185597244 /NCGR_PEP_ID=MMETSP0434-20130131/81244_1 /TAXON_ID=626734 ORGANISM="Favella taraikaensis, Strain Fe Narragansett Bay" /NCGR_SAMPLE_ID=MMETSP0434 /ASSEMBLY_ACC=CAM_ASM_000379 /LENGTH=94 /DNA_ID=CAMNT_0028225917 /DNA_START=621 /DNA_END=905 /DNA_ORIENTATION=-